MGPAHSRCATLLEDIKVLQNIPSKEIRWPKTEIWKCQSSLCVDSPCPSKLIPSCQDEKYLHEADGSTGGNHTEGSLDVGNSDKGKLLFLLTQHFLHNSGSLF